VVAIGWKRLFERDFKRAFENARDARAGLQPLFVHVLADFT
jgi:hypothetical protein